MPHFTKNLKIYSAGKIYHKITYWLFITRRDRLHPIIDVSEMNQSIWLIEQSIPSKQLLLIGFLGIASESFTIKRNFADFFYECQFIDYFLQSFHSFVVMIKIVVGTENLIVMKEDLFLLKNKNVKNISFTEIIVRRAVVTLKSNRCIS